MGADRGAAQPTLGDGPFELGGGEQRGLHREGRQGQEAVGVRSLGSAKPSLNARAIVRPSSGGTQ